MLEAGALPNSKGIAMMHPVCALRAPVHRSIPLILLEILSLMMSSLSEPFEQRQVAAKQPERHHAWAAIIKASLNGISETSVR
jgi:hypothetical protein